MPQAGLANKDDDGAAAPSGEALAGLGCSPPARTFVDLGVASCDDRDVALRKDGSKLDYTSTG